MTLFLTSTALLPFSLVGELIGPLEERPVLRAIAAVSSFIIATAWLGWVFPRIIATCWRAEEIWPAAALGARGSSARGSASR